MRLCGKNGFRNPPPLHIRGEPVTDMARQSVIGQGNYGQLWKKGALFPIAQAEYRQVFWNPPIFPGTGFINPAGQLRIKTECGGIFQQPSLRKARLSADTDPVRGKGNLMLKQALPVSLHKGLFRISRYLWDHAEDIPCLLYTSRCV